MKVFGTHRVDRPDLGGGRCPIGGRNAAHEAIDRHAVGPSQDRPALLWEGRNGELETYTYGELKDLTDRFANLLGSLGMGHGDRTALMMDRIPELHVSIMGALKAGAVAVPIYPALDSTSAKARLAETGARVLITQPQHRFRVDDWVPELFDLDHIIVVNKDARDNYPLRPGDLSYEDEMSKASSTYSAITTDPGASLLHYTSGTTGPPKAIPFRHYAMTQLADTGKWCLDIGPADLVWCTADPGWPLGTCYGMLAPWALGATVFLREGPFDPGGWYRSIQDRGVTVLYTAPTAIHQFMNSGTDTAHAYDLSTLRVAASVGDVLEPEAVAWGRDAFGVPVRDTWWQIETGAILIANDARTDPRPGSIGRPAPDIEVAVLDDNGRELGPGVTGRLAIGRGWPAMFSAYWSETERYEARFEDGWYISGDLASKDEDGYLWFRGRAQEAVPTPIEPRRTADNRLHRLELQR